MLEPGLRLICFVGWSKPPRARRQQTVVEASSDRRGGLANPPLQGTRLTCSLSQRVSFNRMYERRRDGGVVILRPLGTKLTTHPLPNPWIFLKQPPPSPLGTLLGDSERACSRRFRYRGSCFGATSLGPLRDLAVFFVETRRLRKHGQAYLVFVRILSTCSACPLRLCVCVCRS